MNLLLFRIENAEQSAILFPLKLIVVTVSHTLVLTKTLILFQQCASMSQWKELFASNKYPSRSVHQPTVPDGLLCGALLPSIGMSTHLSIRTQYCAELLLRIANFWNADEIPFYPLRDNRSRLWSSQCSITPSNVNLDSTAIKFVSRRFQQSLCWNGDWHPLSRRNLS